MAGIVVLERKRQYVTRASKVTRLRECGALHSGTGHAPVLLRALLHVGRIQRIVTVVKLLALLGIGQDLP